MTGVDPGKPTDADGPISLVKAAAHLGLAQNLLWYHLTAAGHRPAVGEGGRAYLTVTLEEAARILSERKRALAEIDLLPGWSAAHVARALGIQQATVYRLRQLGKLPAAHEVQAIGNRKWRWDPATVRAYAKRVHRDLVE